MNKEDRDEKENISPKPPIREKAETEEIQTETESISCCFPDRAPARVRTRKGRRRQQRNSEINRWQKRLLAAGVSDPVPQIVDYAVKLCHGSEKDRLIWLKIANRNVNTFINAVFQFETEPGHDKLRNPAAALQKRLNRVMPRKRGAQ